ncbi:hypothetical protein Anas_05628 [Armadillidium nasatum]|uniref:THAP-type domain-containing protein n=1 Tax=Armadillidium nasatum TaxID=96803 RepID=A0A5N5STB3_9CRUS|nr:hypothetical protein Anas_05628 [Armadillidium nasatum]
MSYKCAARFCLNKYSRNKQENLTFFTFPIEEKEFREWSDLCDRPDLKEEFIQVKSKRSQKFRLCEKHFNTNDIYNVGSKKVLRKGALPCNTIVQISSRKSDRKLEARPRCYLSPVQETNWMRTSKENFNIGEPDFIQIDVSDILNANTNNSKSSIQGIDERLSNQPNVPEATMPSMRKDTGNHQQDGEIRKSGDTNGPPCSHYIGLIEQKAENYKLQRKIERMADDIRTLKEQLFNLEEEVKKRGVDGDVLLIKEEEIKLEETDED